MNRSDALLLLGIAGIILAIPNLGAQSPERMAEIESEVSWILEQRNSSDSEELFGSYVAHLSSTEVPAALSAFGKIDTRDVVDGDLHQRIITHWTARDPEAAFAYLKPMFRAVTSDHFLDQWEEKALIPNRELLKTLPFMPQSRDLLGLLCLGTQSSGLCASSIPPKRKESIYSEFVELFGPVNDGWDIPTLAELNSMNKKTWAPSMSYDQVIKIRKAALESMPKMYHAYPRWRHITLQRWVEIGPMPPLLPLWMASPDTDHTAAVLGAWAKADVDGLWDFVREFRPNDWALYAGPHILAYVDEERRKQVFAAIPRDDDFRNTVVGSLIQWGEVDPEGAFHGAEEMLDDNEAFGDFAQSLIYARKLGRHERRVARLLMESNRQVSDVNAYVIMEEFGDLDVALASQYGVEWHLRRIAAAAKLTANEREDFAYFPKDHLIRVWSGREDPQDGCMDDRTFGCLRKWAACAPDAMKSWVNTLEDVEIKATLLWMADHPNR